MNQFSQFFVVDTDQASSYLSGLAYDYQSFFQRIEASLPPGPQCDVAMQRLLESRDAAFRATRFPGQ